MIDWRGKYWFYLSNKLFIDIIKFWIPILHIHLYSDFFKMQKL